MKKLHILNQDSSLSNQIMLSIVDISQKILFDNKKAENEMLTLINSTISHEMRNPLNAIINQSYIQDLYMKQIKQKLIESEEVEIEQGQREQCLEIY